MSSGTPGPERRALPRHHARALNDVSVRALRASAPPLAVVRDASVTDRPTPDDAGQEVGA
jgi:hypothetical protein